jgi:Domain of unknown function (DUF4276)
MTQLVFFLEEPSAKEMLKGLLPNVLPHAIDTQYVVFEGKQDLEKRLPIKLKAWQRSDAKFIVMRDQDGGNCIMIKKNLAHKCLEAGKHEILIRIACHELESFYLGDLNAVAKAIGPAHISKQQKKKKFRDPDNLSNPSEELRKLAPEYQKISGSRAIGPHLDINNNHSKSFNALVTGIRKLLVDVA